HARWCGNEANSNCDAIPTDKRRFVTALRSKFCSVGTAVHASPKVPCERGFHPARRSWNGQNHFHQAPNPQTPTHTPILLPTGEPTDDVERTAAGSILDSRVAPS